MPSGLSSFTFALNEVWLMAANRVCDARSQKARRPTGKRPVFVMRKEQLRPLVLSTLTDLPLYKTVARRPLSRY